LLIGSANRSKAKELAELLEGLPWTAQSLADLPETPAPEETGQTFAENAVLKARYYSERFGIACIADDSGLAVDALEGAPGVLSARYAGEYGDDRKNNLRLLEALREVHWHERTARFVCCAAFLSPGGEPHIERGTVEGHIAMEPFGQGGFGYDPLFVPLGHSRTFGEMPAEEKHGLSHRGQALARLRAFLEGWPLVEASEDTD